MLHFLSTYNSQNESGCKQRGNTSDIYRATKTKDKSCIAILKLKQKPYCNSWAESPSDAPCLVEETSSFQRDVDELYTIFLIPLKHLQ